MEIRTLYSFLCAAREGNITKAAEKLHLSQPALSRQLAALEDEVGTLLLIRGKRHLQLTEAGMLLRRRAEEILALVDKTEKELLDQSESLSGTLSIGAAECEAARVLLPQLVKRFHQLHPQVTYAFTSGTADLIRDRIDSGLLDFGILMEPVDLERYDFVRLPFFEEWGAMVSVHAPLAQKESLRPSDLESIPLIYSGRTIVQNEINSWLQDSADRLTILATYDLISNAVSFAADDLGAVIVSRGAYGTHQDERVRFLPFAPTLRTGTVLVWKKHQLFSPLLNRFLEQVYHYLDA